MHPCRCILRLRVTLPGLQVNPAGQQAVAFIQLFRKEKVCLSIALQRLPAQPLKGIGIALQGCFLAPVQALPGIFCCAFALLIVLPQLRLRRGAAEALEVIAHGDAKHCKVIGRRIEALDSVKGRIVRIRMEALNG